MDTNERQIALSVLESLRGDLVYAHLNNGSRVLDVADLRQYIYEQMNLIRTNALTMCELYGFNNALAEASVTAMGTTERRIRKILGARSKQAPGRSFWNELYSVAEFWTLG